MDKLSIRELARDYRMRPNHVYHVLYELEARREIAPKRAGKYLQLTASELQTIEKELQRRGHLKGD
jgi:DNA-binding transcriptional regulator YhcF (GntR family)